MIAMTSTSITYLVAVCCGVFALAAWIGLVAIPAWASYSKTWERLGAVFLSLYVLVAAVLLGLGVGGAGVWLYLQG
jgi:hypothetical protein